MSNLSGVLKEIDEAYEKVLVHVLLAQGQANALLEQGEILFPQEVSLNDYTGRINNALLRVKDEASNYLNNYLMALYQNTGNLLNCFALQSSLFRNLSESSPKEQWIQSFMVLKSVMISYHENIEAMNNLLVKLIGRTTAAISELKKEGDSLNEYFDGDNGILNKFDDDLKSINNKIYGFTTLGFISAALTIGGIVVVFIGSLYSPEVVHSEYIGAKLTTRETYLLVDEKVIFTGFAVTGLSSAGSIASAFEINRWYHEKGLVLIKESRIKVEVRLVLGVANNSEELGRQIGIIFANTKNMESSWLNLMSEIKGLELALRKGDISPAQCYLAFKGSDAVITTTTQHINNMKKAMAGVAIVKTKKNQKIGDAILNTVISTSY